MWCFLCKPGVATCFVSSASTEASQGLVDKTRKIKNCTS
jgi:hypothetical protein